MASAQRQRTFVASQPRGSPVAQRCTLDEMPQVRFESFTSGDTRCCSRALFYLPWNVYRPPGAAKAVSETDRRTQKHRYAHVKSVLQPVARPPGRIARSF